MPLDDIHDDALTSQRVARDADTEGYNPLDPAAWPGGVDPGTVKDALDAVALSGAMDPVAAARVLGRTPAPPPDPLPVMELRNVTRQPTAPELDLGHLILMNRVFCGWS